MQRIRGYFAIHIGKHKAEASYAGKNLEKAKRRNLKMRRSLRKNLGAL